MASFLEIKQLIGEMFNVDNVNETDDIEIKVFHAGKINNLDLSEKYRFQLPISTRKNDALLMLYPTETLDLLPPDAQIDAHLKHQMGISRPRAVAKTQKESPRNGLFKPFLGLFVWQRTHKMIQTQHRFFDCNI